MKVWVDYLPYPKNKFQIKVNDADFYSLVKEEVEFDATRINFLTVELKINEKTAISAKKEKIEWNIDEVAENIE